MKHTYGFHTSTDKNMAITEARAKFAADNGLPSNFEHTVEVIETDAHKENNEFCVVVRTPEVEGV